MVGQSLRFGPDVFAESHLLSAAIGGSGRLVNLAADRARVCPLLGPPCVGLIVRGSASFRKQRLTPEP